MSGFSDITVVSVAGRQRGAIGAALSVQLSAHELPGSRALLISPERPAHLPLWVRHVPVQPFGAMPYNVFMLHALYRFIDTDYALVVQDDGWVVSGRHWRQAYFDCDYVGAPVSPAPDVDAEPILGGAFSLRSQRLMRAPAALGLPTAIPPPHPHCASDVPPEDAWLCIGARQVLEAHGVRFATLDLARSFAIEHADAMLHDGYPLRTIVGHHSRLRKIVSIGGQMPALRYTIPRAESDSIFGEHAIQRMFRSHGWRIEWPDPR